MTKTKKLIYYKDVIDGTEKIVMPDKLTDQEKKNLVIERLKAQPETTFADLNGNQLTKSDVIKEIEKNKGYGKSYYDADISYLSDFLKSFK